jgi:copper homeostasis protein
MPNRYEACVTSIAQARAAERAGADRLELCARIESGGLTPPVERLAAVRSAVALPVHAMIRPRPGDFRYSRAELAWMRRAIREAREAGMNGIVLGTLTGDGQIDVDAVAGLLAGATGLSVTFHRAFDEVADPLPALEQLIALGVARVLTSGGPATARAGTPMLRRLVATARGRIGIIACGTVRASSVRTLMADTGVAEIHAHLRSARDMRALAHAVHAETP